MTATKTNPGPGTSVCPNCGDVWLCQVNPVMAGGIVTSFCCDYELRCVICGAILEKGIAWK